METKREMLEVLSSPHGQSLFLIYLEGERNSENFLAFQELVSCGMIFAAASPVLTKIFLTRIESWRKYQLPNVNLEASLVQEFERLLDSLTKSVLLSSTSSASIPYMEYSSSENIKNVISVREILRKITSACFNNLLDPYMRFMKSDSSIITSQNSKMRTAWSKVDLKGKSVVLNKFAKWPANLPRRDPVSVSIELLTQVLLIADDSSLWYPTKTQGLQLNFEKLEENYLFQQLHVKALELQSLEVKSCSKDYTYEAADKLSFYMNIYNCLYAHAMMVFKGRFPYGNSSILVDRECIRSSVKYCIDGKDMSLQDILLQIRSLFSSICDVVTPECVCQYLLTDMSYFSPPMKPHCFDSSDRKLCQNITRICKRYFQQMVDFDEEHQTVTVPLWDFSIFPIPSGNIAENKIINQIKMPESMLKKPGSNLNLQFGVSSSDPSLLVSPRSKTPVGMISSSQQRENPILSNDGAFVNPLELDDDMDDPTLANKTKEKIKNLAALKSRISTASNSSSLAAERLQNNRPVSNNIPPIDVNILKTGNITSRACSINENLTKVLESWMVEEDVDSSLVDYSRISNSDRNNDPSSANETNRSISFRSPKETMFLQDAVVEEIRHPNNSSATFINPSQADPSNTTTKNNIDQKSGIDTNTIIGDENNKKSKSAREIMMSKRKSWVDNRCKSNEKEIKALQQQILQGDAELLKLAIEDSRRNHSKLKNSIAQLYRSTEFLESFLSSRTARLFNRKECYSVFSVSLVAMANNTNISEDVIMTGTNNNSNVNNNRNSIRNMGQMNLKKKLGWLLGNSSGNSKTTTSSDSTTIGKQKQTYETMIHFCLMMLENQLILRHDDLLKQVIGTDKLLTKKCNSVICFSSLLNHQSANQLEADIEIMFKM